MHHLFKDHACNEYINSSYEQLSSERSLAVWSLCEVTYRWFHKCETCQNVKSKLEGWWQLQSMHLCVFCRVVTISNDTPDNMTQQRWKGWLDCISEYIMYTFDKQARQAWKPAHSETLLSSVSLWMISIIIIWIIRILWPRCWFYTSSGIPVWFHFTHICWKLLKVFDS